MRKYLVNVFNLTILEKAAGYASTGALFSKFKKKMMHFHYGVTKSLVKPLVFGFLSNLQMDLKGRNAPNASTIDVMVDIPKKQNKTKQKQKQKQTKTNRNKNKKQTNKKQTKTKVKTN